MTEILSNEVSILRLIDFTPPEYHPDYKWREKEEKIIKGLLSQSITPESKVKRIESYILNQKNESHNIPAMLIHHTTEYFTHKEYEELHPEIKVYKNTNKELTELSQLREKHKRIITERVNKIGVLLYYAEIKEEVFNYEKFMFPDNIRLLDFLYEEYKIYKIDTINYSVITESEIRETPHKKEPEQKKNVNQSLSVKMNFTGEKEELEKILSNVKGNFLNYTDIKDVINGKENLSLCGNNKDITSLAFFYTLAEMELITITRTNYQQILNTFPELDYQTLKNYNTDLDNPIKSKGINPIIADTEEKERFINRVNELKKILFSEKKIK